MDALINGTFVNVVDTRMYSEMCKFISVSVTL